MASNTAAWALAAERYLSLVSSSLTDSVTQDTAYRTRRRTRNSFIGWESVSGPAQPQAVEPGPAWHITRHGLLLNKFIPSLPTMLAHQDRSRAHEQRAIPPSSWVWDANYSCASICTDSNLETPDGFITVGGTPQTSARCLNARNLPPSILHTAHSVGSWLPTDKSDTSSAPPPVAGIATPAGKSNPAVAYPNITGLGAGWVRGGLSGCVHHPVAVAAVHVSGATGPLRLCLTSNSDR
ncbi:hypothetical protein C8Q76DRAFT_690326 [Earliella scabrosa]|nr:hypothetical protein C8Q76DRAFT_690326 [Earliella scabrosa]